MPVQSVNDAKSSRRCSGDEPCKQCSSSRSPRRCFYTEQRQRSFPSKHTFQTLCHSLDLYRSIVELLYPGHDVADLSDMSRIELLDSLGSPHSSVARDTGSYAMLSPQASTSTGTHLTTPSADDSDTSLCELELIPDGDAEWGEKRIEKEDKPAMADDVNALSLSLNRHTSYLCASSVKAALLVMVRIRPDLEAFLATSRDDRLSAGAILLKALPLCSTITCDNSPILWSRKGQTFLDAYFKRVHVLIPMLDEATFRADYLGGKRADRGWLALVNAVLAMGSVAALQSDNFDHLDFCRKAMDYLPMESLGDGNIESLQALMILGGFYLHYVSRPNLANALLGAAFRMASALGLHREAACTSSSIPSVRNGSPAVEIKRRTWWSLFCLDTWANTTTGRPSFGRCDPMVNVSYPERGAASTEMASHGVLGVQPHRSSIFALVESSEFCKMATEIQDALATRPLLRREERQSFDSRLVHWYENLPQPLQQADASNESLRLAICVMKWRYYNLRMLLHRPVLLHLAMKPTAFPVGVETGSGADVDNEAVEKCRELANATIQDIASEWMQDQISGWNAAWFLYQAALVPLHSLLIAPLDPRAVEWRHTMETALGSLEAMEKWSLSAAQSRQALLKIYKFSGSSDLPDNYSFTSDLGQGSVLSADATVVETEWDSFLPDDQLGLGCMKDTDMAMRSVIRGFTGPEWNESNGTTMPYLDWSREGCFPQQENVISVNTGTNGDFYLL